MRDRGCEIRTIALRVTPDLRAGAQAAGAALAQATVSRGRRAASAAPRLPRVRRWSSPTYLSRAGLGSGARVDRALALKLARPREQPALLDVKAFERSPLSCKLFAASETAG